MQNPWEILGVHRKSTDEEIREAFHNLAKIYHPDTMEKSYSFKFYQINEAYQLIKDKKRRTEYLKRLTGTSSCKECTGTGVRTKSKGITAKTYLACKGCKGSGLIFNKKENKNVVIELRGTAGSGRKGSDKER
jgi:DnaJ-class molecular chaperone